LSLFGQLQTSAFPPKFLSGHASAVLLLLLLLLQLIYLSIEIYHRHDEQSL